MTPSFCLFVCFLYIVGLGIELGALCFATELCHQSNLFFVFVCLFFFSGFETVYLHISEVNLGVLYTPIWSWNHCSPWWSLTHNPCFCSLLGDISRCVDMIPSELGNWTQGPMHVRQVLRHWALSLALHFVSWWKHPLIAKLCCGIIGCFKTLILM